MTKTPKTVKVGDVVTYIDEYKKPHDALVTCLHGADGEGTKCTCLNLVYVSGNENENDSYGRQISRETSLVHESLQSEGRYWK